MLSDAVKLHRRLPQQAVALAQNGPEWLLVIGDVELLEHNFDILLDFGVVLRRHRGAQMVFDVKIAEARQHRTQETAFEVGVTAGQLHPCRFRILIDVPGGSVRGERANFTRLVLGCIEANFASKYSCESSRRDLHNTLLCTVF